MRLRLFPVPETVKMGFSDRIRVPFGMVWVARSPWPFFGIDLTTYGVRSANPRLFVGGLFNVGPSIKGVEVVHVPGGMIRSVGHQRR